MHPLINEYYKTIKAVMECFIIYLKDVWARGSMSKRLLKKGSDWIFLAALAKLVDTVHLLCHKYIIIGPAVQFSWTAVTLLTYKGG